MPRKNKSQAKRSGGKSGKHNKSRKSRWMNHVLNVLNYNTLSKYWSTTAISLSIKILICITTLCVCYKPSLVITSTHYLSKMNPITFVFQSSSTISFRSAPIITNAPNNIHHTNVNNNNGVNQFCRIQTPSPPFQRQLESENKGYVEFQGCRIVPTQDQGLQGVPPNVQLMSNEEKDINEIMAQLQSNAIIGDSILSINAINNNNNNNNNQPKSKKKSKKEKKKTKKKKKARIKKIEVDYADTDRLRELDEMNEFGIDSTVDKTQQMKKKNKERTRKKEYKTAKAKSNIKSHTHSNNNSNMAWKPRRIINQEIFKHNTEGIGYDDDESNDTDTEIDANLMGMYQRGFSIQLNKMHYTSDAVYEQIMEDISNNGVSQSDIYDKYHIDFIPDESSFKLMPPPAITEDSDVYKEVNRFDQIQQKHKINAFRHVDMHRIQTKMNANSNSKQAFKNFYALTRMQQKYLKTKPSVADEKKQHKNIHPRKHKQNIVTNHINDTYKHEDIYEDDMEEDEDEDDDEHALSVLRNILGKTPKDVLSVILNDDKLPQWLYESDTILDINCGIGDALIYLLSNFTTIRGICVVGTNDIKYKYAQINIAQHDLLDRVDIIHRDVYDPYVASLYNESDIVYINWYNIDEQYVSYLVTKLMNDHHLRSSKPGRVILSYNRLLFDERVFQASYTLHFAAGWRLEEEEALVNDVSMYMYSIPFYLSKLSNLYVQNYQVFYGYHPVFDGLDFKFDLNNDTNIELRHDNNTAQQINVVQEDAYDDDVSTKEPQEEEVSGIKVEYDENDLFRQLSTMMEENTESDAADGAMMDIVTHTMNVLDEMDVFEIEHIWDNIASQLIYTSFMTAIQETTKHDMSTNYAKILMRMLQSINERKRENVQTHDMELDDWQYLEYIMFTKHREDPPCAAYKYLLEQWRIQMNALLDDFYSTFFYQQVKDTVNHKMQSLLEPCE